MKPDIQTVRRLQVFRLMCLFLYIFHTTLKVQVTQIITTDHLLGPTLPTLSDIF